MVIDSESSVSLALLERKIIREHRAREEAERLLETKSLELFQAREESEKRRQFVTDAIEAMRDGFAVVDAHGHILLWNASLLNLLQVAPGDSVKDKMIGDLIVKAIAGVKQDAMNDFKPEDANRYFEEKRVVEFITSSGETLEISAGPTSGLGRPVTIRNTTTRKRMEAQLLAAHKQEALGTLAGGIAHEINTPTQYIGDNLRFIQDSVTEFSAVIDVLLENGGQGDRERLSEIIERDHDLAFLKQETPMAIQQALEGVAQIAKIVAAVRLYSHPSGEVRTESSVEELVDNAILVSKNEWKYASTLEKKVAPDLPLVPIYVDGIKQVLLNLIVNAAHAISDKDREPESEQNRIEISVDQTINHLEIVVDDTGPGVPDQLVEKVFDPFFTTKAPGVGTGQGLAICRRIIVDQHGGQFEYNKSRLGGASFKLRLPLTVQELAS